MFTGISLRSDLAEKYGEERDSADIRLYNFARNFNGIPVLLPNNELIITSYLANIHFSFFILSGGNDLSLFNKSELSVRRDLVETKILDFAVQKNIPVFGICRGAQMIANYFGAKLIQRAHIGNHNVIADTGEIKVNSYHNYCIEQTGTSLEVIAKAGDLTIEAFRHKKHKIAGVMWHPEREGRLNEIDSLLINYCNQ